MTTSLAEPTTTVIPEQEMTFSTDKPECSHLVQVPEGEPDQTPQAYVTRARIEGFVIVAVCGFVWVPSKNAEGLPVCQECWDIYQTSGMEGGHDDRDRLPEQ